jgi:hypothetical protein
MLERSPLANAWTAAQANAFWDERADGIAADTESTGDNVTIGSVAVGPR